jgi:outer membrane receptor protein involved in Fe transport
MTGWVFFQTGQKSNMNVISRLTASAAMLAAALPSLAASPDDPTSLSLEQLLGVTVIGANKYEQKQSEVAAAVSVITRQEIKAFGWRTLGEALGSLPGVSTNYDRQYSNIGIRGFGFPGDLNTRALITINGNRLNDSIYDQGAVGRDFPLSMDMVDRIEFIPGPGGAVYGQNAMFGVVNVITRTGASLDGALLVGTYESPQSAVEGSLSWGKRLDNGVDILVSGSGLHSKGQDLFFDYGAAGMSGVAAGQDGEKNQQFFARLAYGAWSFDFTHGDRQKDDPTGVFLSDPLVAGQFQRDLRAAAQLQYKESFAQDTLQVLARLFTGTERYTSTLSYGTPFSFPATGDWSGVELRLLSTAFSGHKFLLGFEHQENTRQDQFILDLANPVNDISIQKTGYRTGLYAQDEWRISEALIATLGLRVDRDDVTGVKTSPRAALIWQAAPTTTLKALYGVAHRSPNAFESGYGDGVAQVANPALKGETIETLELVADHRVSNDLAVRASAYQWTMHNLIALGIDPVSTLAQFQTGQTVNAKGIELSADKTWANGARLRGSLSRQEVAYDAAGRLPNSPQVLGKINLSGPLPWAGWRAGYELRYDSNRLTLNGDSLGDYAISNLHLSTQSLAKGLELSLGITNLFDKRYAQPGSRNNWQDSFEQDGRGVRMQLRYRF